MNSISEYAQLLAIVAIGAVVGGLAIGAAVAPAAAQTDDEIANETVNVTDPGNQSVWVDVEFGADNAEIEATLLNTTGTELANETLMGADGTTDSVEWNATLLQESGNHTVVVSGNESDVAGLWIGLGDSDGTAVIAPSDGSSGTQTPVAAVVVAVLAALGAALTFRGS